MVLLFTDFGLAGPYVGQMHAKLQSLAPGVSRVDLFHDAPCYNPRASAYLLAAYTAHLPLDSVILAVVDPGVGDAARRAIVVRADGRWLVGPDNGLLSVVARRARVVRGWEITWRPEYLSTSFHGRDLFAPVAARLALGESPPGTTIELDSLIGWDWPEDLSEVVYIDHFGNVMTGMRAHGVAPNARVEVSGQIVTHARTFSEVPVGTPFWYENSNGLLEIAVNQGHAAAQLGVGINAPCKIV